MSEWQPWPDPAFDDPQRPGLRPHRHPPTRLHPWVFLQDEVWVDFWGNEQEIELMTADYVANVIVFCEERASLIWVLVARESIRLELDHTSSPLAQAIYRDALSADLPSVSASASVDVVGWLHTLPLLRALSRRSQRLTATANDVEEQERQ